MSEKEEYYMYVEIFCDAILEGPFGLRVDTVQVMAFDGDYAIGEVSSAHGEWQSKSYFAEVDGAGHKTIADAIEFVRDMHKSHKKDIARRKLN